MQTPTGDAGPRQPKCVADFAQRNQQSRLDVRTVRGLNGVAHGMVAKIGNHAAARVVKERANTDLALPQHPQSVLGLAE